MTSLRRFSAQDLLQFNNVNLDYFTETVSAVLLPPGTAVQARSCGARTGCASWLRTPHARCRALSTISTSTSTTWPSGLSTAR